MNNIPTPHNECVDKDKIAKIVLMPGDPLRAKFIVDNYLTDVIQFNGVRNILGYTGYYEGKKISVMASGMGMPSIGIYSYELYNFYDVDTIVRIGSAGTFDENLNVNDIVLVSEAYSDTNYAKIAYGYKNHILKPSASLNKKMEKIANKLNIKIEKARIYSSDVFYSKLDRGFLKTKFKCRAVEMESFALFANAKYANKNAACILTISDGNGKELSASERERSFKNMMVLALNLAK